MPTGYTATLHDGEQDFADFVLNCARAFGHLIELRDSPHAEIPDEFTLDPYYEDALARAQARLTDVEGWTDADAQAESDAEHAAAVERVAVANVGIAGRRARYQAMLDEVQTWTPPTVHHEGLKRFMVEQLEESMRCDCVPVPIPQPVDGETYRQRQLEDASRDVGYHAEAMVKATQRAAERTAWVRALRASIPETVTTKEQP